MGRFLEWVIVAFLALMLNDYLFRDIPKAIDVYRGKTELKLEYTIVDKDTVSVDSTVVFKQNIK